MQYRVQPDCNSVDKTLWGNLFYSINLKHFHYMQIEHTLFVQTQMFFQHTHVIIIYRLVIYL